MADVSPLLPALVAQYGLSGALQLLKLLDPNASTASKGFAGAQAGNLALQGASRVSPSIASATSGVAPYLGSLLSAAGLGYGLTNIAKSDMPIKKKVGHSVDSAVAAAVPMYGLSKVADYVFNKMEQSKSPQVSRFGQTLAAPTLPVQSFLSVLKGDQSPRAAGSALLNSTLSALGMGGYKPTTGTMFRHEASSVFDQIPELKGTDTSKYNIDLSVYNALPQNVRDEAQGLGTKIAGLTPDAKSNPQAYANQIAAMILNRYGANLPAINLR